MKQSSFSFLKITAGCIAAAVVLSLGLHAVQLEHTHPGDMAHTHSEGHAADTAAPELSSYLHMAEKKMFDVDATSLSVFWILVIAGWSAFLLRQKLLVGIVRRQLVSVVHLNGRYLERCFSDGILHSKRYMSSARS